MATIQVTKDIEELLEALKKEHPALDKAEILKRALAEYRQRELLKRKKAWEESLPIMAKARSAHLLRQSMRQSVVS